MGKIILCSGEMAKNPYIHNETGIEIYSMEELCYFIYNNIDILDNNFFNDDLARWVELEVKLEKRGKRLQELNASQTNVKDIIVYILCSTDYYSEREIKELIYHMDDYGLLSPYEKKKKEAGSHMKYEKYMRALILYEELLEMIPREDIPTNELGDIYHNLGVAKANTKGVEYAIPEFKRGYEYNKNENTIILYLTSLLYVGRVSEFNQSVLDYTVSQSVVDKVKEISDISKYPMSKEYEDDYNKLVSISKEENQTFFEQSSLYMDTIKKKYRSING